MRILLAGFLVACVIGCSGNAPSRPDELQIKQEQDIPVEGGPTIGSLTPDALNPTNAGDGLSSELTTTLSNQGAKKDEVKSVTLSQLHLEVTAPVRNGMVAQDLRFLDRLTMNISAMGLPDVLVAESLPPPNGADAGAAGGVPQSASFGRDVIGVDIPPVPGVELKDYVTGDSMDVNVTVEANGRPAFSCTVHVKIVMNVKLNPAAVAKNRFPTP